MTLGEILKKLRERNGWSQSESAKKLEVSGQVISNYERNYRTPDITMMKKISELYEVSLNFLLSTDDLKEAEYYKLINEYLESSGMTIEDIARIAKEKSIKEGGWNHFNDLTVDFLKKLFDSEELPTSEGTNEALAQIIGGDAKKINLALIKLMGTEEAKNIAINYENYNLFIEDILLEFIKDIDSPNNDSALLRFSKDESVYTTLKELFNHFGADSINSLTLQAKIRMFIELTRKISTNEIQSNGKGISIEINDTELTDEERLILVDELENYFHYKKQRLISDRKQ